ncbi:hypothetical protein [Bradyrhizobium sp. STM 3557]|uniref:hypothetical protein n=1 Tax=Bradyrhizobium sp. STM 3557 TaxID=578920 RepID=UPI00388F9A75
MALLLRTTSWVFDPELLVLSASWEAAWLPQPLIGLPDPIIARVVDVAALGHAVHATIRPAALLPDPVLAEDPFVMALRRIEFENGRIMQAQIIFLKGQDLLPCREAVSAAVEGRHVQVRKLWSDMLAGIGVGNDKAV